ncbi:MAG: hypothetical protein B6242_11810 [Anaerolineaceae bacterium 4572_78]|nr:MAG: hypothetical protein B6242_11810 [Anaerolineaceae bacterium 4572_78]
MNFEEQIQKATNLIKHAKKVVVLTGAGISTPSGIPDFRSAGSGLWKKFNPMEVASIGAFHQNPNRFYEWVRPLVQKILDAKPNSAHIALAELESKGYIDAVITQNIDNLHQVAGSKNVLEVHGHIREINCAIDGSIPKCSKCGSGSLKPNVVLFGEMLPAQVMIEAEKAVDEADLILVAGSSLEVSPISEMPHRVVLHGKKIIVVNLQDTYIGSKADVVIQRNVVDVLPKIAEFMRR